MEHQSFPAESSNNQPETRDEIQAALKALKKGYEQLLNNHAAQQHKLEAQSEELRQCLVQLSNSGAESRQARPPTRNAESKAPISQRHSGKSSEKNSTSLQAFSSLIKGQLNFELWTTRVCFHEQCAI